MLCKRVSLSIEAPLRNLEGFPCLDFTRKKYGISGFLYWTHRTLRSSVWRPYGTLVKGQGSAELISGKGTGLR